MNGHSNINDLNISKNGVFHFNVNGAGNRLIIENDYSSVGGTLVFHSKLAGDDSETDYMLVKGNTSGHTNVKVVNVDGIGAQTDLGILLIEVEGLSNGEFKQDGRNVAGAYEYFLRRGSEADRSKNWYMVSDAASFDHHAAPKKKTAESESIPELGDDKKIEPNNNPHEVVNTTGKGFPANPIIQFLATAIGPDKKELEAESVPKLEGNKTIEPNNNPHEVVKTAGKGFPANPIIQFLATAIGPDKKELEAESVPKLEGNKTIEPNNNPHEVVKTTGKGFPANPIIQFLATAIGLDKKELELAHSRQQTDSTIETDNTSTDKSPKAAKNIQPKDVDVVAPQDKAWTKSNKNIPRKTYKPVYRPENGSYIANLSMARNLFTADLENRSGNYKYKDAATGEWRSSSMWIHTQGGRKQFGNAVDQLNIKGKYHSIQLGGDLAQWDIGTQGRGRMGMLAGLGKATNYSQSKVTGYYSHGSVNGYNLGMYATWLADQQNKTGLYIDTLAQYSWFNNTVNGQQQAEEKYKSSGFTSSVESGYTFNIGSTDPLSYFIQPNAKITWLGINAKTHTTANKDVINYNNRGQLTTRIGAKTYLQTTNTSNLQFMPFIAINWLYQNKNTGTQLSGQHVEKKSKNSAEFKIGVESKIDQQLHAWVNINHQMGNYNTSNTNALVGMKYSF